MFRRLIESNAKGSKPNHEKIAGLRPSASEATGAFT